MEQLRLFGRGLSGGIVADVLAGFSLEIKFDVVIADPPYNIGKNFGTTLDTMPINDYVQWTRRWLTRCFELLATHGLIYVYGFPEILARIAAEYPIDEQRWLVWHYTNKAVPSSSFWQRSHESILCLWRPGTKRPALEVDQIREPYTETFLNCSGKVRKETESRFGGQRGKATIYQAHEAGALPRDVMKIPALAGGGWTGRTLVPVLRLRRDPLSPCRVGTAPEAPDTETSDPKAHGIDQATHPFTD